MVTVLDSYGVRFLESAATRITTGRLKHLFRAIMQVRGVAIRDSVNEISVI